MIYRFVMLGISSISGSNEEKLFKSPAMVFGSKHKRKQAAKSLGPQTLSLGVDSVWSRV